MTDPRTIAVEEDGDEIFTPMPTKCPRWLPETRAYCGGEVKPERGFMFCQNPICRVSWGTANG